MFASPPAECWEAVNADAIPACRRLILTFVRCFISVCDIVPAVGVVVAATAPDEVMSSELTALSELAAPSDRFAISGTAAKASGEE